MAGDTYPARELDLTDDQRRVYARTKERMIGAGTYEGVDDMMIALFATTIVEWRNGRRALSILPPDQRTDEFREMVEAERLSARHLAAQLLLIDPAREHIAALDDGGGDEDLAQLLE